MNRKAFCDALRSNLAGMPQAAIDEILSDYEAHFTDGAAAGRSEEEIAAALGDPARLARELRVEAGLSRWETKRSPGNALAAVLALLGLGALDIFILLPFVFAFAAALVGLYFASIGIFVGGAAVFAFGPFTAPPGGPFVAVLFGLGMIAAALCLAAILTLITIGLVNAIVWFARLHYRALKIAEASA
jgi:uncharacterized membrane protein